MGQYFKNQQTLLDHLKTARVGRRLVFTNGCFDILHLGHMSRRHHTKEKENRSYSRFFLRVFQSQKFRLQIHEEEQSFLE